MKYSAERSFRCTERQGSICVLAGQATGGDFLYIVDRAVEEPLNVDLDPSSYGKTVQSLLGANIAKYRLDYGHALGIDLLTSLRSYLLNDSFAEIGGFAANRNG